MREAGQPLLGSTCAGPSQSLSPALALNRGSWSRASLTLGAYFSCQVAYHGIFTSLVLYLKRVRNLENAAAVATASAVLGSEFCTSFFAAFLSDGFLGRHWTSVLILTLFFLGSFFLSIITQLQLNTPIFFTFSLYLAGFGYGWFKPSLAVLGGDQFAVSKDRNTFYNYLFVASTVGEVLSLSVVSYIENRGHWAAGYWICTVRKRNVKVPTNPDVLFDSHEELYYLTHTNRFRFLDKAATACNGDMNGSQAVSPWRLCSVQNVEEVKTLVNILPIWAILLCKGVTTSQLTSLFIEQETIRLSKAHSGLQLSILWLVQQYCFEGITLVCAVGGEADFFYSAAAPGVRSLSSSLPVLSRGLASYISSLLITIITSITTAKGKLGWIAADLNDGHLNYFYFLLAAIATMAFIVFLVFVRGFSFPHFSPQQKILSPH